MKNKKIEFKNISFKDSELLNNLSKNEQFKSYLKSHKEINSDFAGLLENKKSHFTYCVGSLGDHLVSLILTADVSKEQPDYMTPLIEEEKKTLWMDYLLLGKKEVTPEDSAEWLTAFVVFCPKEIGALISDPEVSRASTITSYEMAGFTRVGSFIKGQGFFKGTSHYLMKRKIEALA